MNVINNHSDSFQKRRNLRNNATPQKRSLWLRIKNSQINGQKFIRQHSIRKYIIDFFCPLLNIAIEIDGSQHFEKEAEVYDSERTDYLESFGIIVIRFTNAEINNNIEGVILKINSILESPPPPAPSLHEQYTFWLEYELRKSCDDGTNHRLTSIRRGVNAELHLTLNF